jgi:hypothetical protein
LFLHIPPSSTPSQCSLCDTPGLRDPVDLLPHLHQLETLTASHLPLPVYQNDVDLPLVYTLRHLSLRAVSIQWMSGRTFQALESCTLFFPHHRHVLHTFRTTLPNCKRLTFEGYPLDILDGVSAHNINHLSVMCSCSFKTRGNRQLARFSSEALRESRLAPRILHIGIEATDKAWINALTLMSVLEELLINNEQPSSLGLKAVQSLVVHPVHSNNLGTIATAGGWNTPVCPSLKRFGLRYRRWLRPSEHFDLIPVFASIVRSREQSKFSLESFLIWPMGDPLELIEGSGISLERFERLAKAGAIKGENSINSANGVSFLVSTYPSIFHFVTALSLDTPGLRDPVDLLPHLHQLETLTASHLPLPVYHNDVDLPFVHTLRHLSLRAVSIQWMGGRTFHVLERCTLISPLYGYVLHAFRTTLPNCEHLSFEGHPLDMLDGVSAHKLTHLSMVCSSPGEQRGNRELARSSSQALRESQLAPEILHIGTEATNEAWITALAFMSNLEELVIHNAQPPSPGVKVLQSLAVQPVRTSNHSMPPTPRGLNALFRSSLKRFEPTYRRWLQPSKHFASVQVSDTQSTFSLQSSRTIQSPVDRPVHANNPDTTATPGELSTPLCPSLKRFRLQYRHRLQPNEYFDLIPVFKSIIQSREQSKFSLESFLIWTRGDVVNPLELIEGSGISLGGFERLAKEGAITEGDF